MQEISSRVTASRLFELTYVLPRLQILRLDRIVMETVPLLECFAGKLVVFLIIPRQHFLLELETDALAVFP
jgi:hypothetical protein